MFIIILLIIINSFLIGYILGHKRAINFAKKHLSEISNKRDFIITGK